MALQPPPIRTNPLDGSQFALEWLRWLQATRAVINDGLAAIRTVATGGTGLATLTPYAVLTGGTTATGVMQQIGLGTTTTVLHGNAAGLATFSAVALTADVTGTLPLTNGGLGLTSGTSGGILGFTAAGTLASSVVLTNHAIMLGRGAAATPVPLGSLGTSTTVLHGAAAGDPTFGAVSLTADVTGTLPAANGGTGVANSSTITLGGNLTLSGAFTTTVTVTGNTSVTLPTSGTLLTAAGAVTSITGTANQVVASAGVGDVTLSLPQSIATASTPQFARLGLGAAADGTRLLTVADGTTAPGTSIGAAIVNYYGTAATNFLGDPAAWLYVRVAGTDRKIPCY